jgi:hypothetical protein
MTVSCETVSILSGASIVEAQDREVTRPVCIHCANGTWKTPGAEAPGVFM